VSFGNATAGGPARGRLSLTGLCGRQLKLLYRREQPFNAELSQKKTL